MLSALHGGFFFFFATCITIMGILVFFLVPETKGRTLERMDEIFGTAYGDLVNIELRDYRRERGLVSGAGVEKKDAGKGEVGIRERYDGMEIVEVDGERDAEVQKEG
jgi:hypothetical protein